VNRSSSAADEAPKRKKKKKKSTASSQRASANEDATATEVRYMTAAAVTILTVVVFQEVLINAEFNADAYIELLRNK